MSSISNNLIPSKKDHIFISLVFIVLIYVMLCYPYFRASIMNTILGRAIMLICIIYLTYYNVAHGLAAIIILIGMHVDNDLEGFEQPVGMSKKAIIPTPTPVPSPVSSSSSSSSPSPVSSPVPIPVSSSSSSPSPVSSPVPIPVPIPVSSPINVNKDKLKTDATTTKIEAFSHHKKLRIEEGMRPKSSKSLNTPFFGTSSNEPSPNWPDNAVFTTAYAPV
jgi:hypothetical protein